MKHTAHQSRQPGALTHFAHAMMCRAAILAVLLSIVGVHSIAQAAPPANTQDYLKSLSDGVGGKVPPKKTAAAEEPTASGSNEEINSSHFLAFLVLIVAVVLIVIWWGNREERPKKIKQVNHSRKLLRQISREMGLAGAEVKQLKLLADVHERLSGKALQSPLTLLICPSILGATLQESDIKIDRAVVASLARRLSRQAAKV